MITTVVSPSQLQAPPGSVLRIPATWQQYQQVVNQRGDDSIPRLKYRHGEPDPPPDLVIEVDVTSYSDVDDYLPYRVTEVWLWKKQALTIYQLQGDSYRLSLSSLFFPNVALPTLVQGCFNDAYERNTGFAIRNLRQGLL